jgi:thioredoxin reductase (NADPH)
MREVEIDIAIVGGGPAGLTAALYAARARRRTVVFEAGIVGGQIASTGIVENYPGFPDGVNGLDLALAMQRQAERFGAEVRPQTVTALRGDGAAFVLTIDGDEPHEVRARAVIVTAGAEPLRLGVPGESELTGSGVSYCATCDAPLFRDVPVVVVGGGDAALDEGLFAARFASKVTIVHRRDALRASAILQERVFAEPRIEVVWNTVVERINGSDHVESVTLRDVVTGATRELAIVAVFVFIGQRPNAELLTGLVPLDRGGHARVNLWMETAVPGLFAAGDVRTDAAKQLVSAAGDGATAAIRADRYLASMHTARDPVTSAPPG